MSNDDQLKVSKTESKKRAFKEYYSVYKAKNFI